MGEEKKAPFNMALNTLERLGDILKEIKTFNSNPFLDAIQKQSSTIELTKAFYEQASPLLKKEMVKKFNWILSLEPKLVKMIKQNVSGYTHEPQHDPNLSVKMSTARVLIQIALQKSGYFMPTKEESLF